MMSSILLKLIGFVHGDGMIINVYLYVKLMCKGVCRVLATFLVKHPAAKGCTDDDTLAILPIYIYIQGVERPSGAFA
jgi:hypothetical protein